MLVYCEWSGARVMYTSSFIFLCELLLLPQNEYCLSYACSRAQIVLTVQYVARVLNFSASSLI